jgi:hypothetical protein
VLRDLWNFAKAAMRFAAATAAALLPRRYWARLDVRLPVSRAALLSALATVALAAVIGVPAFFRHAETNAGLATDVMLRATGWSAAKPGAPAPAQKLAVATWGASYLSFFTFAFLTPIGLLTTYLVLTGLVRAVATAADDARGDPILTAIDAVGRRAWQMTRAHRTRLARERLEGPEVPDRLVPGRAAGFPDADYVVVASRRKPGWEAGAFVITSEKWYRLGTPVERQMPGGLRTLYPLTELRDHEVLRRGIRYELPALSGSPLKSD